jgi:hypothetical protein
LDIESKTILRMIHHLDAARAVSSYVHRSLEGRIDLHQMIIAADFDRLRFGSSQTESLCEAAHPPAPVVGGELRRRH